MSGLQGNPSATSRVAGSATSNSVKAEFAASSAPGSDPVDGSEPVVLQPPKQG